MPTFTPTGEPCGAVVTDIDLAAPLRDEVVAALRTALDDGTVARASLDVATPEPLPADHWMFEHPSVLLTPHTSWAGPGAFQKMVDTFEANYRRWRAEEPLEGTVDVEAGY